jgi:hypothetical protein
MSDKDFVVKNGLSVNGAVFVVNTGSNSVGVNTSSPDAALKVVGTANVTGNVTFSANLTVSGNVYANLVGSVTGNLTGNVVGTANNANNFGALPPSAYALANTVLANSATAYSNAVSFSANATNLTSGTVNTSLLPATISIGTALNVGANVSMNTTAFSVGNSTVNIVANSSTISGGANATFNVVSATSISGNGSSITSVNAGTVGGNSASDLRGYSNTTAATAYSNAVSYANTISGTAYSNAVSYAVSIAGTAYSNAVAAIAVSTANATTYILGGGSVTTNTFTVGTAAYHVANGNFGVGTSAPGYTLDVNGTANISGAIRLGQAIVENYAAPSISSNTLTVDLSTATVFNVSLNSAITTLSITNYSVSRAQAFTIFFTADGTQRSITWPASMKWAGNTAPTMTATSGKVDIVTFVTNNGGTTWYGFVGGQNF